MKKLITACVLVFVLIFSILPFSVYADVIGGNIVVGDAEGKIGDKVSVNMVMSDNPGFISANLYVNYDMSVLKLVEVKDGGILKGPTHSDQYTSPYGLCWIDDLAPADTHFNGEIVTLVFEILDTNKAQTIITLDQDIVNFDLEYVRFNVSGGTIKITNPKPGGGSENSVVDGKNSQNVDSDMTGDRNEGLTFPSGSNSVSATDKNGAVISDAATSPSNSEDSENSGNFVLIIVAAAVCVLGAVGYAIYRRIKK